MAKNRRSNIKTLGSRMKSITLTYLGGSSIRGLPRVIKASSLTSTIVWIIIVGSFTGIAVWQTVDIVCDYFKYETTFQEKIIDDRLMPFPSVTICNLQPLNSENSARKAMERYLKRLKEVVDNTDLRVLDPMKTMSGFFQNTKRSVIRNISHSTKLMIRDCSYMYNLYDDDKVRTQKCNDSKYTHFPHASYFNCYTISPSYQHQSEEEDEEKRKDISPFIQTLYLTIYLDDFQYPFFVDDFDNLAMRHGIRLTIHPPGTYPDIENKAHEVMPGTFASFHVTTQRWDFQEPPYGNCSKDSKKTLDVADPDGQRNLTYTYDQNTCNQLCLQKTIIDRCTCLDPTMPLPVNFRVDDESYKMDSIDHRRRKREAGRLSHDDEGYYVVPYCLKWQDTDDRMESINLYYNRWRCWSKHANRLALHRAGNTCKRDDLHCKATCNRTVHTIRSTFSRWPHESFHEALYKQLIKPEPKIAKHFSEYESIFAQMHKNHTLGYKLLQSDNRINRNFIRLRITRRDAAVKTMHSIPVFPISRLLSSVGGCVNLWSGITMIALIEFIELFVLLLQLLCRSPTECQPSSEATQGLLK